MRTFVVFAGLMMSGVSFAQDAEPELCVDTLTCGGFCGTQSEVDAWLSDCDAGPHGPCFSDCWNSCLHSAAASNGNNPNLSVCSFECVTAACPNDAAQGGLLQAGLTDACPVPDPSVLCFQLFAPVDCGGCTYSNSCVAASAGFAVGQCTDVEPVLVTQ